MAIKGQRTKQMAPVHCNRPGLSRALVLFVNEFSTEANGTTSSWFVDGEATVPTILVLEISPPNGPNQLVENFVAIQTARLTPSGTSASAHSRYQGCAAGEHSTMKRNIS